MANGNDYIIPFGIDMSKVFEGIKQTDQLVDGMVAGVTDATKLMQKGFNDAAAAGEKLEDTLRVDAQQAAILREQARALGKELGDALSGKGASSDFEKRLNRFNELLAKFSTNANKPIKFNLDTAKLAEFEKLLSEGADELQILNQVIAVTKEQLATMDPNTQEFQALNAQLQIAEGFLEGLGDTTDKVNVKNKSLKTELREIKAALAEMELAGQDNTEEFERLAIRGGQLEDQIGDISARVRVLASDTKYIDAGIQAFQGLTGAIAAGQGAMALFGAENEEAQIIIQRVAGAMAVLQGIQAVSQALNKDSALSVLLFSRAQQGAAVSTTALATATTVQAGATTAATTATRAFTAALLANPVTAILVGIAALVTALIAFSDGSDDAEKATKRLNDELERQKEILDLDEASLKRRTDLLVAQAKAQGKLQSDITTIEGQALADRINLRQAALSELIKLDNDENLRRKISAEDYKKLQEDIVKLESDIADDRTELEIKRIERDGQLKKQQEDADKKALEAAKKIAEERKKILEQQLKFSADLEKARVDAITDQYERERAEARQAVDQRIKELQAETSLSAKAERDKQALIKQLRLNLAEDILEIDRKQAAEQAALQLRAQQLTIQYREEGIVKEMETLRLGYVEKRREIEEQFKNEIDLRDELLALLGEAQIREQKALQNRFTNEAIKNQEEQAVLEVETAARFLSGLAGVEEQKQIEVLRVKLVYAQRAMDALLAQGNAENSTVVLQAKKQVQELQKALGAAIDDLATKTPAIDWFKMLGLGELTEEQRAAVVDAAQSALNSVREITGFIIEQYQRQIDKKQEVIDQLDDEISDLEDRLDKEMELRENGFANEVETVKAELDEKKKAREEELRQQEELQKRQAQMQRVQLALDTVAQASNLITSASNIFKALSPIPFIGIPLAITTIALMTGAFIAAKIKAFQLTSEQSQRFGGGGWIEGKTHSRGGEKYYSADGKKVKELEDGEHVTNRKQAARYAGLLDAINNDDISGMSQDALRDMLEGMGISLSSDEPKQVVKIVRERDEYRQAAMIGESQSQDIGKDIRQINENVGYLAGREKDRTERWEDGEYLYTRKGNKTTKIKKG
jgi:hypothetical protein